MSLTKIVVVVDETFKEIFEGENIEASVSSTDIRGKATPDAILSIVETINLGSQETHKELASFKHWTYWRYTK